MRRLVLFCALASLATFSPLFAEADDFQSAYERVEKQQHLAMIEKGISSNDARTISMLGYMTYGHRTCGDAAVTADDIEKIWSYLKSGPSLGETTRKSEAGSYADALAKAVVGLPAFDKQGFCDKTAKNLLALKKDWGLN